MSAFFLLWDFGFLLGSIRDPTYFCLDCCCTTVQDSAQHETQLNQILIEKLKAEIFLFKFIAPPPPPNTSYPPKEYYKKTLLGFRPYPYELRAFHTNSKLFSLLISSSLSDY